jgi:hypothetical protein
MALENYRHYKMRSLTEQRYFTYFVTQSERAEKGNHHAAKIYDWNWSYAGVGAGCGALCPTANQEFYNGKVIRIIVGFRRRQLRHLCPVFIAIHGQIYTRQSDDHRRKHARRGQFNFGQLYLSGG